MLVTSCKAKTNEASEVELENFTLVELSKYNGVEGNPAYIAVDGIVYDVTNIPQWKNGQHNGFEAGKDLTEEIKNLSPHGVSKLSKAKKVGRLLQ